MGILLWAGSGVLAFLVARLIPAGRTSRRGWELGAALVSAPALGVLATALDFGGWQELDWRAALLAFLGALAAAGAARLALLR